MKNAILVFVLIIFRFAVIAQTVKIDMTVAPKIDSANKLFKLVTNPGIGAVTSEPSKIKHSKLILDYAFTDTIHRFFNQVSGVVIKSGQVQSISTVLDDKSLTINYTIPFSNLKWLSIQPTVSGSSSNGVVNVFKGDKFAKTLTFGSNFNFWFHGSAWFPTNKKHPYLLYLADANAVHAKEFADYKDKKRMAISELVLEKGVWNRCRYRI